MSVGLEMRQEWQATVMYERDAEVDLRHPVRNHLHDPALQVEPLQHRIQGNQAHGIT